MYDAGMASGSSHGIFSEETSIYIRKTFLRLKSQTQEAVRPLVLKIKATIQYLKKLASRSPHPDPLVEAELKRLEDALKRLQEYAQKVITSCRNLAYRASNKLVLQKISSELKQGQVMELKQFLSQIHDCLMNCTAHVDTFDIYYQSLKQELEKALKSQAKKSEKTKKEISRKEAGGLASAVTAVGSGATAVGFGVATIATGGAVAVFAGVITGVAAAGAAISGGTSIGLGISKAFNEKELQLIKNAAEAVLNMQSEMNNTKLKIVEMDRCISEARERIEGLKSADIPGLRDYAENPTYSEEGELTHFFVIENDLEDLQDAMKDLLKIIDEDD